MDDGIERIPEGLIDNWWEPKWAKQGWTEGVLRKSWKSMVMVKGMLTVKAYYGFCRGRHQKISNTMFKAREKKITNKSGRGDTLVD